MRCKVMPVSAAIATTIIGITLACAAVSPCITPFDPAAVGVGAPFSGFSAAHPLGTDNLGRDIASRIIGGARWTVGVSLVIAVAVMVIGTAIGVVTAMAGGWVDVVITRIIDTLLAVPSLVLVLALIGMIGPGLRSLAIAVIAIWWAETARLVRSMVSEIVRRPFIEASRAAGAHPARTALRDILPNLMPRLLTVATTEFGSILLALSSFGYLGLGAQPPDPEWGRMLSDARPFFQLYPSVLLVPGGAVAIVVASCYVVGDALADRVAQG